MRNYNAISPSAKGLLLMKSLTDIPFMADAVKLIFGSNHQEGDKPSINEAYIKRLIHFEARYKSINNLLETLGGQNIVEISAGFSFRGLQMTLDNPDINYVDTDLAELIVDKDHLITQLITEKNLDVKGNLMQVPMNVLDEESVIKTTDLLPSGKVSIVNEGLMMYFNEAEKIQMCQNIHKVLAKRGGYWATADIYIKKQELVMPDDQVSQFLQSHNVEANKFESYKQAEDFFYSQGFKIIKKAEPVLTLSAFKYLPQPIIQQLFIDAKRIGKIRESWALAVI